jgi:DNA-binding response OmpR family regulator
MQQPATVLVVDDEPDIVDLMRDFLEAEGYTVLTAPEAETAQTLLKEHEVDCLLLDVMMPGQSGFDLLRAVREERDIPVLFLSARQEDRDKIRGLALGADDYIVKSATPTEVVARVKAVLRRYRRGEPLAQTMIEFGRLAIDPLAREVLVDGAPVAFTPREYDLLEFLAEHPRQAFTREQLYERFWGDYGDRHSLTVHIARIREKIETDPSDPQIIATVWGVGYRFEGEPVR